MQCDDTQTKIYLSVSFSGLDMVSAVDQEADELSGTGAPQLGGIVLLLDETCFGIDHQTQRADFLSAVHGMAATIEKNKETSICKRACSDHRTTAVQEERPHILGGTRTCEVELS